MNFPSHFRSRGAVVWLAIGLFHAAVVALLAGRLAPVPDEDAYVELARNVARHGSFHLDRESYWHAAGQPFTLFAPGWPFAMTVGQWLFGEPLGNWIVLALVWWLSSWLIHRVAIEAGLDEKARWMAVAWLTLNPLYLFYHGHLMTESATIALALAQSASALAFLSAPTVRRCALLGVLCGLGHLVRSQLLLPGLAAALVAALCIPPRRWPPLVLAFVAAYFTVTAPWLWRMNQVGGGPTLSTELKLGVNFYTYSGSTVTDPYRDEGELVYPPGIAAMTPVERDATFLREGLRGVLERPGTYLRRCARRLQLMLSPVPNYHATTVLTALAFLLSVALFFYLPLGITAARWRISRGVLRQPPARYFALCLVLWYGFHLAVHAAMRNRLPSDPWLVLLALLFWQRSADGDGAARRQLDVGA